MFEGLGFRVSGDWGGGLSPSRFEALLFAGSGRIKVHGSKVNFGALISTYTMWGFLIITITIVESIPEPCSNFSGHNMRSFRVGGFGF